VGSLIPHILQIVKPIATIFTLLNSYEIFMSATAAEWQLTEAQNKLPELIQLTAQAPQTIMDSNKSGAAAVPIAVVLSARSYQRLQRAASGVAFDFSPPREVAPNSPRDRQLSGADAEFEQQLWQLSRKGKIIPPLRRQSAPLPPPMTEKIDYLATLDDVRSERR
jgi:hypothetical protein